MKSMAERKKSSKSVRNGAKKAASKEKPQLDRVKKDTSNQKYGDTDNHSFQKREKKC